MLPRRIDLCSSSTSSSSAHKYGRAESLGVRQQASARALRSRLCELRERESPRASPVRHLLVWLTGPGQQASARVVANPSARLQGRSEPAHASDGHLYLIGLNSFRLANLAVTSGLLSPYFF